MDHVVTITNIKENDIEFDVDVQGVKSDEIDVRFIIEAKGMEIGFPAKKENDKWCVTIPPLPFLERTGYNFHICVIADGYHFEPLRGMVNVVASPEVYTTTPKNITVAPTEQTPEVKSEEPKVEPKTTSISFEDPEEKSLVKQIASRIMGNKSKTEESDNKEKSSETDDVITSIIKKISEQKPKKEPDDKKESDEKDESKDESSDKDKSDEKEESGEKDNVIKDIIKKVSEQKPKKKAAKKKVAAKKKEDEEQVEESKKSPVKHVETVPVKEQEIKDIIKQVKTHETIETHKNPVSFKRGKLLH